MRSSVCALNAATADNFNMNFPDYDQTTAHHSCLLLLIRGIGVNLHISILVDVFNYSRLFLAQQTANAAENL